MTTNEPTVVEAPSGRGGLDSDTAPDAGITTRRDAVDAAVTRLTTVAMSSQEAARARATLLPVSVLFFVAAGALQATSTRGPVHWVLTAAIAGTGVYSTILYFVTRRDPVVDRRKMMPLGIAMALLGMGAIAYLGVLSPAVAVPFALVFSAGLGESSVEAWLVYLTCAFGYLVLVVLALSGVMPPTEAVMPYGKDPTRALLGFPIVYEGLLAMTFWASRASRRATVSAIQKLEYANQQIRRRDALLVEAQGDLDRALDAGRVGRFTGQEVGPYAVGEVIGRGGMGEVYRARRDQDTVALKVLHSHLEDDPAQAERFLREARAAGAIDSLHIVRVFDDGAAADGSPYLAMELLRGQDLAERLREQPALPASATVDLIEQVARGLAAAKEAGIVHRDLKPQNLFWAEVGSERVWKILDFGVSKMEQVATMTQQGALVGTPSYMSPEQADGRDVDHRSDVFSLGVIAYRAITGQPPFAAPDPTLCIYNVMYVQPLRPGELVELPPDVDRVLAIALSKDRDGRFRSAATFASALRDALRGELDEPFRRAADAIVETHPWGSDRNVRRRG